MFYLRFLMLSNIRVKLYLGFEVEYYRICLEGGGGGLGEGEGGDRQFELPVLHCVP